MEEVFRSFIECVKVAFFVMRTWLVSRAVVVCVCIFVYGGGFSVFYRVCKSSLTFLLGGLLLLLLLATLSRCSAVVSCGRCWCFLFLLLLLLLLAAAGDKESNHSLALKEAIVINLELAEDVVNFSLGELVAKVQKCVAEHLSLNLALNLVGLESAHDQVIRIIGASSHLFLEHLDHVVECASASDLRQHVVEFSLRHELANVVESSTDVVLGDGAILVDVHQLEALLIHLELLLGEASIVALAHFGVLGVLCFYTSNPSVLF